MPTDGRAPAAALLVAAFSLAGAGIALLATPHGPGIAPNSVVYLSAAEHLRAGEGFLALRQQGGVGPLAHYPPLFPLLIAAGGLTGLPLAEAGRWLNALAFTAAALLLGGLIRQAGGSLSRALAGIALFVTAVQSLEIFAFLLSEGVFVALLLLSLWALARHLRTESRGALAAAAAFMAMAVLTRYAGAAFGAAGALAILVLGTAPPRARWVRASLFGVASILPMGLWMIRNMLNTETAANRHMAFHAVTMEQAGKGIQTMAGWIGPTGLPGSLQAVVAAAVAATAVLSWLGTRLRAGERPASPGQIRLLDLVALWIAAYLGLLLVSLTFVDAATPLTRRILTPVFTLGLILVLGGFRPWFLPDRFARAGRVSTALLLAGIALFSTARAVAWVREARATGLGYSSLRWRGSELMAAVRGLPPALPLLTNAVEPVYYLAGRVCGELPARQDKYSREILAEFEQRLRAIAEEVGSSRAAVVWVEGVRREHLVDYDELRRVLGPPAIQVDGEGAIFR